MHTLLEPGFILHHRPYRETSVLLDVFSEKHGRISLIARGVRTSRSRQRPLLQLFIPLLLSWFGRGELLMMKDVDNHGAAITLRGDCLLSGLYLNELLMRVLQKNDPHPLLFAMYHQTLLELQGPTLHQKVLRLFEKKCLEELGYGLSFCDHMNGEALRPDQLYYFFPEKGFVAQDALMKNKNSAFQGKSLLAFHEGRLDDEVSCRDAKRLMRLAISALLGLQSFHSRQLFQGERPVCQTA